MENGTSKSVEIVRKPCGGLDLVAYTREQLTTVFLCPLNRHGTRVRHSCNDFFLFQRPELLMAHFMENGGAEEFAKRRAEFQNHVCDRADVCCFGGQCELREVQSYWRHCPAHNMDRSEKRKLLAWLLKDLAENDPEIKVP